MNYVNITLAIGPIDWILGLFGKLLAFLDSLTGVYLVTILIFAVFAKVVMFPLSIKQQKSSIKQAKLRPKEQAIRKKYQGRTDQVTQSKMNQEIMDLYQSEGYSPFGGCLPLLLQFPIILGLYELIRNPLKHICGISAEVITKIKETIASIGPEVLGYSESLLKGDKFNGTELDCVSILQNKENFDLIAEQVDMGITHGQLPNFKIFGFDLSVVPNSAFDNLELIAYLLVPVLTFVIMFFSMKLTKKLTYQPMQNQQQDQMGCAGKMMDYIFPLMSTWIAFIVPSLLGVYWMFNNILGVLQSLILRKLYPLPVFTEEDYKAAEREIKGKRPISNERDSRVIEGKRYVSLHHIDDEDYDENGTYIGKSEDSSKTEKNGAMKIDVPELKEDRPHKDKK